MKSRRYILLIGLLISLPFVSLWLGVTSAAQPGQKIFAIDSRMFGYEPGRIVVNVGDTVTFNVKTSDVTHGFFIDGYGVDETVAYGEEKSITIVADKVGKFKIRCSATCGPLHPFMVGEFVVEQGGVNLLFFGSASIIVIVGLAAFAVISRRSGQVG